MIRNVPLIHFCLLRFTTVFPPFRVFAFATLLLVAASRRTLSSDPEFLLEFMHDLPDESDSDDDFDGYLEPDDGPVAYRREENVEEPERRWSSSRRSRSLESLAETEQGPPLDTESPLVSLSPSYSPMQGHNASRSPLAATTLPQGTPELLQARALAARLQAAALSLTLQAEVLSLTLQAAAPPTLAQMPLQAAAPPTLAQTPLALQAAAPPTLAQMPLQEAAPPSPPRLTFLRYCIT